MDPNHKGRSTPDPPHPDATTPRTPDAGVHNDRGFTHGFHEEAAELFAELAELNPVDAAARLDAVGRANPALRDAAQRLIEADRLANQTPSGFLEGSACIDALASLAEEIVGDAAAPTIPPDAIGSFKILREIGRGGMGVVYEAEQAQPRRTVAIKVLHPWFATRPEGRRRFEFEAEALARLDHPGIARVYQADHGGDARHPPYIVMELVRGVTIARHVREHRSTPAQHASLIVRIADAVHHAHTRGIVHRDLKPDNILIDHLGQPRILDFGVAALIDPHDRLTLTADASKIVGSLVTMCPEQAAGDATDIDPRADVYSLGAILYILLTGQPPFRLEGKSLTQALRVIESEAPVPMRSIDPRVPADLEAIVSKAMRKDRAHRYGSAAELAEDLRRFLAFQPVIARAPGPVYHAARFVRRNRLLVAFLSAFILLLTAVAVGFAALSSTLEDARQDAVDGRQAAINLNGLLAQSLTLVPQAAAGGRTDELRVQMNGILDRVESGALASSPELDADVRMQITEVCRGLGMLDLADRAITGLLVQLRERPGVSARLLSEVANNAANIKRDLGLPALAEPLYAEALAIGRTILAPDAPDLAIIISNHAYSLLDVGKSQEAEAGFREAESIQRMTMPEHHPLVAATRLNLVYCKLQQQDFTEAERIARDVLRVAREQPEPHPHTVLRAMTNISWALRKQLRYAEAAGMTAQVLDHLRSPDGDQSQDYAVALTNHADNLISAGNYGDAEAAAREALPILIHRVGSDHDDTRACLARLITTLQATGRSEEAAEFRRQLTPASPGASPIEP